VKDLSDKPFALVGVNVNAYAPARLKEVMEKEGLNWRSFADERDESRTDAYPGRIANGWHLDGTPNLYVIDHKGVIRHHWLGSPGEKVLDGILAGLIKDAEADARGPR
jgi:hypothetical protein